MEEHERHVTTEHVASPGNVGAKIAQVVWLVVVIITIFLAIRVVFALLGANLENPFAAFIYNLTEPFVWPFRGLLQVGQVQYGVSRFEFETMVAIFVYMLAGWGITAVIRTLSSRPE